MNVVGKCKLRLGSQFEDAIVKAVYENEPLPIHTALECDNKINNVYGEQIGRINIFVRLSCFGSTIITQFQLSGTEHQDYVFKTSKKDNTIEAQKKKGFLYAGVGEKKETEKDPKYKNDISSFNPLLTDDNAFLSTSESAKPSVCIEPNKYVSWKKYMKRCNLENSHDKWSVESYNKETKNSNMNNCPCENKIQKPPRPPCPLPDCDCYSTGNDDQDKCSLSGCNCYDPRSMQPSSYSQQNNKKFVASRRGCCTSGSFSKHSEINKDNISFQNQRISTQINNKCGVGDCDCYLSKLQPNNQNNKSLNLRHLSNSSPSRLSQDKPFNSRPLQQGCCSGQKLGNLSEQNNTKCCNCTCNEKGYSNTHGSTSNAASSIGCSNVNAHCTGRSSIQSKGLSSTFTTKCDCNTIRSGSTGRDITNQYGPLSPCNKDQKQITKGRLSADLNSAPQPDEKKIESVSPPPPPEEVTKQIEKQEEQPKGGEDENKPNTNETTPTSFSQNLPQKNDTPDIETKKSQTVHKEKDKPKSNHHSGGGDGLSERELLIAKRRRKKYYSSIYDYTEGKYPDNVFGHRHCTKEYRNVPKTMGWLWTVGDSGDGLPARRGWKPGAINTKINAMLKKAKKAGAPTEKQEAVTPTKSVKSKRKRPNQPRGGHTTSSQNIGDFSAGPQSPTLHVHKKDGAYFISMNPLKTDSEEDEEERSPLMFKILPHEDEESTTSESSLEIEFTAPGAFRRKPIKPIMAEIDTQYSDPDSVKEALEPPGGKGKKGEKGAAKKAETPPSTKGSEPKDNKWDADQPTQIAKTKK